MDVGGIRDSASLESEVVLMGLELPAWMFPSFMVIVLLGVGSSLMDSAGLVILTSDGGALCRFDTSPSTTSSESGLALSSPLHATGLSFSVGQIVCMDRSRCGSIAS